MKKILLTLALATAFSAQAVEYTQVQTDKSTIHFTYKQMGVAVDGQFRKFASQITFDPAKPSAAKATFEVELASVDTGTSPSPPSPSTVAKKPKGCTPVMRATTISPVLVAR